jgi:uncharacterized protein YuzE
MRIRYDERADALYVRLAETAIVESEEVNDGLILDYDESGEFVGFELLQASRRRPSADLRHVEFERS